MQGDACEVLRAHAAPLARRLPAKPTHRHDPVAGEVRKNVAIVGKGLTFDSGGYNIKAGAGSMIEMMKARGRGWLLRYGLL